MLRDGFYKVDFAASLPGSGGIVVLDYGSIRGADDQMLYSGSYSITGNDLTAEISVQPYVKGANSVFNTGNQPFRLKLTGSANGATFSLSGPLPNGGPGIVVSGTFIAPIGL